MSLSIVFAPAARTGLVRITKFIKQRWGKNSSDKFKEQVDKTLNNVSQQPYMFKASTLTHEIRKGIVSKQTSFFYKVHKDRIEILFFWDNRQQPIID